MAIKTGFIGLGAMGYPMALTLHASKLLTGIWNRTPATAEKFAAQTGCPISATAEELAAHCDAVVLCVSADNDVLALVKTIAPHLPANAIVLDCSTVSAQTARAAEQILAEYNCGFLDCPVSGGTEGAQHGTLSIMCGGAAATFNRAQAILEALGSRNLHMGPAGAGQATKAVNQIMVAGINQAVSEALAFANAEQLPLDKVIDATGAGAAASWFLKNRGPNMQHNTFPLGFKVSLHDKDLEIVQRMAAVHNVQLPIVEMTRYHYQRLLQQNNRAEDISSLFRLKRTLFEEGDRQ